MKTSELTGAALDWAVAKCEHPDLVWGNSIGIHHASHQIVIPHLPEPQCYWSPSTNWAQAGPIIERERLWIGYSAVQQSQSLRLFAMEDAVVQCHKTVYPPQPKSTTGPTILIAAMRCYVASKLGNEVEVPKELAGGNGHEAS